MKPNEQPLLKFKSYCIPETDVNINIDKKDIDKSFEVELSVEPEFSNDLTSKEFSLIIKLRVFDSENSENVRIKAIAYFETNESISSEFKESSFVKINAPAIVFPYLRSYITTISINAGFSPIILPTFNFTASNK